MRTEYGRTGSWDTENTSSAGPLVLPTTRVCLHLVPAFPRIPCCQVPWPALHKCGSMAHLPHTVIPLPALLPAERRGVVVIHYSQCHTDPHPEGVTRFRGSCLSSAALTMALHMHQAHPRGSAQHCYILLYLKQMTSPVRASLAHKQLSRTLEMLPCRCQPFRTVLQGPGSDPAPSPQPTEVLRL